MLKKQLAINMFANIFAFLINSGISVLLTPYLIKTVGSEAYSFFPLANNFISYTSIITVALNSMAARFITIKIHENDNDSANIYFNSVLGGNTAIAIVLSIIGIFVILNLSSIINIPDELLKQVKHLFLMVFMALIINIIGSVFSVATFVRNRIELAAIRNIQSKLIYVLCIITSFTLFNPSVAYIGICNLIATIFILITNIIYTKKLLPEISISKKYFDIKAIKELTSSGIWNTINQLSVILLNGLDLLICNIFISASAAGEYAIVQTIPNLIQSLVATLVGVFVPQFTILYAQKDQNSLIDSINRSIKFMGLTITIPIGFLIVFGDVFYSLWVPGENFRKLHMLSTLVIIPMIVTGSINTIFNVYTVTNKLKIPSIVLLITGIANTITVIILLKTTSLGIFAIPITSLIIGLLRNLIFTPIYAAKCLNVKWNVFYKAIARGVICTLSMLMVCYILKRNVYINSWIVLILIGVISSILSFSINLIIILNKNERKQIAHILKKIKTRRSII